MRARFKRPGVEGKHWRYGLIMNPRARYDEDVSDAAIRDDRTGGLYVIRREFVQVQIRGPRGGLNWQRL